MIFLSLSCNFIYPLSSNCIPFCVVKKKCTSIHDDPGPCKPFSYQRTTHIKNYTPIVTITIVISISVKLITGVQFESPCTDTKRSKKMSRKELNSRAVRYRNTLNKLPDYALEAKCRLMAIKAGSW